MPANTYRKPTARKTQGTAATRRIPGPVGRRQVKNTAGGYVFATSDWDRLQRFLILGTSGGTYYTSERALTEQNTAMLAALAERDGPRFVQAIVDVSLAGRAPKTQPALYALAIASAAKNDNTRKAALSAVPAVCRTGTHLFTYLGYVKQFRGTGRGVREALSSWYLDNPVDKVAYQAIKYRNREGYTHRDVLRIAHPKTSENDRKALFEWIVRGGEIPTYDSLTLVEGFVRSQKARSAQEQARLVAEYRLPWEAVNQDYINTSEVWNALIDNGLPYTALMRQLPRLTNLGIAKSRSREIAERLSNGELIRKSRVHPISVLTALSTYRNGRGRSGSWIAVTSIIDALDRAFYASFENVEPANKRTLIGLDVSGSMGMATLDAGLTAREITTAMSLITLATEPQCEVMGFTNEFIPLHLSPRQRLDDAVRSTKNLPFGRTDCAQPMVYATKNNLEVDTFVIYTDNETWCGRIQPVQALAEYRRASGIDARLVVAATTATGFTIADPNDKGMLDVVGFDSAVPNLISSFSRGDF